MRQHPAVEFVRYIAIIAIVCTSINPIMLGIFAIGAIMMLGMKKPSFYIGLASMILFIMLVNILTNHRGETFLIYMNDNIITLESIIYGFVLGLQVTILMILCMIFSRAMTSEKIIIVTSYLSPALSLLISMSVRSFYRYKDKLLEIFHFQISQLSKQTTFTKLVAGVRSISILINWSLENGIESADSMTMRGYGSTRRTSYSPIRLNSHDILEILCIIIMSIIIFITNPYILISPRIEIHYNIINTIVLIILMIYAVSEEIIARRYKEKIYKGSDLTAGYQV